MKKRKIVINANYGGFGLPPEGIREYLNLKRKDCYFYENDYAPPLYRKISKDRADKKPYVFVTTKDYGETADSIEDEYYDDTKIPRDDPDLIKVVEGLIRKGKARDLKVVSIPVDVDWVIEEYDGMEWIAEKHRIWE